MTAPLSVLETLWSQNSVRCVFVRQLQPPVLAIQVFDGADAVYTELADSREEALNLAATLRAVFIDRPA